MSEHENEAFFEAVRKMRESSEQMSKEQQSYASKLADRSNEYERRLRSVKLAMMSVALAGACAAMVPVMSQFLGWDSNRSIISRGIVFSDPSKFASADEVELLRSSVSKAEELLSSAIKQINQPNNNGQVLIVELTSLKAAVKSIDERLEILERSISENPEKALSIPMLRKDQENMSKAIEGNKVAVSAELTRIYDQQKWILGGIGTVLFAAVTALLAALFKMILKGKETD
ncbi:hypothetical protein [Pseudomonas atacamensis]|uniref:hypothetical protein n=1 Tax=Pseudomonas atacamensis TaxID=2565368 RepID=UPI00244CBA9B|nr:hypothetical protein [Pseudomonas atacamensis]MDH2077200.1 hypothetical protein [Pseudomonas atacamensis]